MDQNVQALAEKVYNFNDIIAPNNALQGNYKENKR